MFANEVFVTFVHNGKPFNVVSITVAVKHEALHILIVYG